MNLETKFLDPNPKQSVRLFFVPSSIRIQKSATYLLSLGINKVKAYYMQSIQLTVHTKQCLKFLNIYMEINGIEDQCVISDNPQPHLILSELMEHLVNP